MADVSAQADSNPHGRAWIQRGVRLLDADPELAAGLGPEEFKQVQEHAVLPTLGLDPGPWTIEMLEHARGVHGEVHGFLLLDGTVTIDLAIGARACTRLITPGELVLFDEAREDSLPLHWGWTAFENSTVAILDRRLLVFARRWPGLTAAILRRAAQQMRHALLQQAICQLPRVEDRLLTFMWSLADRRGVVRADGVWVHLPVTHDALARMIGARRPTVSLGLGRLQQQGALRPQGCGWLIARDSIDDLTGSIGVAEPALTLTLPEEPEEKLGVA